MPQGPLADLGLASSLGAIAKGELGPLAVLVQALRTAEPALRAQPFVKMTSLSAEAKACAVATLLDIDDCIAVQVSHIPLGPTRDEYVAYILGLRARMMCAAIDSLNSQTGEPS